jgi:hypothetical protein
MLFGPCLSRLAVSFVLCALVLAGLPTNARSTDQPGQIALAADTQTKVVPWALTKALKEDKHVLIAQANCATCGAELVPAVLLATGGKEQRNQSLLTDSLWGNLILELAYDRDPELSKLSKSVRLMNFGTTTSVFGIAGGTLAQGISALYVLNPPAGKPDSYAPLNLGVALSSVTMLVLASRVYLGHKLAKHILQQQLQIKDRVQTALAHLEHSDGQCGDARSQLKDLIGQRACNEWIQLWQSSHKLASKDDRRISLKIDTQTKVASGTAPSIAGGASK